MEKIIEIKITAKQQEYLKTYLFENPDISLRQALNQAIDVLLTDYFDNQQTDLNNVSNINDPRLCNLLHLIDSCYDSSEDSKQVNEPLNALREYQTKNPTATYAQIIHDTFKAFHKRFFQKVFYENGIPYVEGRTGNNAPLKMHLDSWMKQSNTP